MCRDPGIDTEKIRSKLSSDLPRSSTPPKYGFTAEPMSSADGRKKKDGKKKYSFIVDIPVATNGGGCVRSNALTVMD